MRTRHSVSRPQGHSQSTICPDLIYLDCSPVAIGSGRHSSVRHRLLVPDSRDGLERLSPSKSHSYRELTEYDNFYTR